MKVIVTGDLHLGRRCSCLPASLAAELTPATMWRTMVRRAVTEKVDGVLLTGDVVDKGNKFFEALTPLEEGLRDLAAARIPCLAVSGNHDFDVLPRLEKALGTEAFHVLGRGGTWEMRLLPGLAGASLQVCGWSFPREVVTHSPFAAGAFSAIRVDPRLPAIGLLHGDLDTPESPYGRAATAEFTGTGVPLWLLGHVHKPGDYALARRRVPAVLYTGSPLGLDPGPGETGNHGPWLAAWDGLSWELQKLPLAPVLYASDVPLDLTDAQTVGDVQERLATQLRTWGLQRLTETPDLRCAVVRLRVQGRTALPLAAVEEKLLEATRTPVTVGALVIVLNSSTLALQPPLDFAAAATTRSPLGVAVRLYLELAGDGPLGPETDAWVNKLQQEQLRTYFASDPALCADAMGRDARPDSRRCRELLRDQALLLIDALHAHREGQP